MIWTSWIYLVEAKNGLVKIGCSHCPQTRFVAIRGHSPMPTRLIACWPGNNADECKLHKRFRSYRSHCEWFTMSDEVADFVQSVRGVGIDGPISDWDVEGGPLPQKEVTRIRRSASMKKVWADPSRREKWVKALRHGQARRHKKLRPDLYPREGRT